MALDEREEKLRHQWARLQQQRRLSDNRVATELGVSAGSWLYWRSTRGYPKPRTRGRTRDASHDMGRFQILVRGLEAGRDNREMAREAGVSYRVWMHWRGQVGVPVREARKSTPSAPARKGKARKARKARKAPAA